MKGSYVLVISHYDYHHLKDIEGFLSQLSSCLNYSKASYGIVYNATFNSTVVSHIQVKKSTPKGIFDLNRTYKEYESQKKLENKVLIDYEKKIASILAERRKIAFDENKNLSNAMKYEQLIEIKRQFYKDVLKSFIKKNEQMCNKLLAHLKPITRPVISNKAPKSAS